MRRVAFSLLLLGAAISGLTWACVASPSFSSSKLTGPVVIAVGSQATYKMTAVRATGSAEDDTARATWDVTPASIARVDRPGVVTGLGEGLATVTATLDNTVSTLSLRVLIPGDFHVSGTVRDPAGNPIPGASVATTGAPFAQGTTDANGAFTLSNVYGLTTLRASLLGFTNDRQVNVDANTSGVDFTVPIPAGFVNITGNWTTTWTPPPACASLLPAAAQARTYTVAIKQSASSLTFTFSSPTLLFSLPFVGVVNASGLSLPLLTNYYYYYYYGPFASTLFDKFGPGQWLDVKGQIQIPTLASTAMTGTLAGEFDYYSADASFTQPPPSAKPIVRCVGSTSVTFTRLLSAAAARIRR